MCSSNSTVANTLAVARVSTSVFDSIFFPPDVVYAGQEMRMREQGSPDGVFACTSKIEAPDLCAESALIIH